GLAGLMTEATQEMLRRWRTPAERGEPLDVAAEMIRLTLAIVGRALFGVDLGSDAGAIGPAVSTILEFREHRLGALVPVPLFLPTPANLRFRAAIRTLDAIVFALIADRRRTARDTGDFLSMLLATRDEETGQGLTDREVRDQALTF